MRTLHFIESSSRVLLRLAPPCFRRHWQTELLETVRESCLDAHRSSGWRGMVSTGVLEMSNVGETALRARLGSGPTITSGRPPKPPDNQLGKGTRTMQLIAHDLKLAVRSLMASKTTAGIAIATLALGIGINAAVFTILDSTVLRPIPFSNADRYDEVWTQYLDGGFTVPGSSRETILEWRRHADLFDRVEAYDLTSFIHQTDDGAEMMTGAFVTPDLLPMLGIRPIVGRLFSAGDGRDGTAQRVIIRERVWRSRFLSDPDVLGRTMAFNGQAFEIIGVMPETFRFPNSAPEFWVPYDLASPPTQLRALPSDLVTFVRRAPGVSPEAMKEMVVARGEAVQQAGGAPEGRGARAGMARLVDNRTGRSLWVLGGAVAFLLLIVCANLANLSLSRAVTRSRDFAVRASLGASRTDLVRETMFEHLIIGVAGAGLGLVVARATLAVTVGFLPRSFLISSMNVIDLDGRALLFAVAIGITTALLFGLPSAWLAARAGVGEALKQHSRSATGSRGARRLRGALVVVEVMLAIVLLVGAALMARSFVKLQGVEKGFDSTGLVALRIGMPTVGYADPYAQDQYVERLLDRVRKIPGVRGATAGSVPPDQDLISFSELEFANRPGELTESIVLSTYQVWPDYFEQIGIPLRAGRAFADGEPAESVIVSESFVAEYYPDGNAVGSTFRYSGRETWQQIVGVAGEVRQNSLDDTMGRFEFYRPLKRAPGLPVSATRTTSAITSYRTIGIRADDPAAVTEAIRRAVHLEDARIVIWELESIERKFADAVARPRLVLLLMSVFAGLGLVLAAAGIYGVLSYLVVQRRREIGIRLALGALPQGIGRLILANGLKLTAIGLALGVVAALWLVGVMQSLLYEVEATDPLSVLVVALVLLITAAAASWWPARRAMRVSPLELLRDE